MGDIKFEYGFDSVNGIVKKRYHLHEIPNIKDICDVWNILPLVYVIQYIGRKDIYDKEIYSGFIIKNGLSGTWLVQELSNGYFSLLGICDKYKDKEFDISALNNNCEIIGNKFENPELLTNFVKPVLSISRCCGRCDGINDICVSDMLCDIHDEQGCEECYGKRGIN